MKYIVGLGNPGDEYQNTRHNAGRIFAQMLQKTWKLPAFQEKKEWQALTTKGVVEALGAVTLILPQTFMNKSGGSVKTIKTKPDRVIVAHDDADIALGAFKISFGRGSAGHRGVDSLMRALGTKNFWRVRIGIQRKKRVDAMKLVLEPFRAPEKKTLNAILRAAEKRLKLM